MKALRNWFHTLFQPRTARRPQSARFRPAVESLEERRVMSVTYQGGALLPHVGVESLFLGSNWNNDATLYQQAGQFDGFLQTITDSSYMDMLTRAGYGVGRGQFLDGKIDLMNPGGSIADTQIQGEIQNFINHGYLGSPDANRLYFVFVEPGVTVTLGNENSITGFYGYHNSFRGLDAQGNAAHIRYAVIPYQGGGNAQFLPSPFDGMTEAASHELTEAVTDPDPNSGWYDATFRYGNSVGGEIGDIANLQYVRWQGYVVQKEAGQDEGLLVPPGTLTAAGQNVTANAGQDFQGGVATFNDGDHFVSHNSYQALIHWGDGQVSWGEILPVGNGNYQVTGAHTYARGGSYTVTVDVSDSNGTSAEASSSATVGQNTPSQRYVRAAYLATLGRPATSQELAYWSSLLDQGMPLTSFSSALVHSAEYYGNFVTAAYHRYLGRAPDAAGLAGWVQGLQQGLTDEQLEAAFIGSAEYIQDHGGTGDAWIKGMYHDLLGRAPDAAGLASWEYVLDNGLESAQQVAFGFAASAEREGQRVTAEYLKYLGRQPAPSEVNGWVSAFQAGVTNEDVVAGFVGSVEYYQEHSAG